jgi:LasA protease
VELYLHIADQDRVAAGTRLKTNDRIGHPSCVGGVATGTHVHIARKYNGEWFAAGLPVPFVLSGWTAASGSKLYHGSLTKAGQTVTSRLDDIYTSLINR